MTNLLTTSVNWRVEIVSLFRESLRRLDPANRVVTADTDPLAAANYFGDRHYAVPRYEEAGYLDALHDLCAAEKIDFIVPQTDRDCRYFAGHRDAIESRGPRLLMPAPDKVAMLTDKQLCHDFFRERGFLMPETYPAGEIDRLRRYPLIVKPRRDSGSAGVRVVRDSDELRCAFRYVADPLIEDFIAGEEYTVDGAANLDGSIIGLVPRRRLLVKGGVSIRGVTCYDREMIDIAGAAMRLVAPAGFFCLQFIRREGRCYLIEINARVGTGLVLSAAAGLDISRIMAAYARQESIFFEDGFFQTDMYMLQYLKPCFRRREQLL